MRLNHQLLTLLAPAGVGWGGCAGAGQLTDTTFAWFTTEARRGCRQHDQEEEEEEAQEAEATWRWRGYCP